MTLLIRPALFVCAVALLLSQVSSVVVLGEESTAELSGVYYCHGSDGNGKHYRGRVLIGQHADVYYLEWRFDSGPNAVGIGIRRGNVLAVSYYGRTVGVVLYEIDGTTLDGRWTDAAAPGRLFLETLTRIPDDEIESDQEIESDDEVEQPERPVRKPSGVRI